MDTKNIEWHASGFLNDASYTSDLSNLLKDFKDRFPGAESLVLNLEEILVGTKNRKESRVFSEDGKQIEINIYEWRERDKKRKFKEAPDANSVYHTIINVLNKAVDEYAKKFSEKNE